MAAQNSPVRKRILRAAVDLLARGGRDAVSTRAVSAAAGVQAPAIYRQFGDMQGLLDAAAREVLAAYVRQKAARTPSTDPINDLRRGWDEHIAFGLANPAAYSLIYGNSSGEGEGEAPAAREGLLFLQALVTRVAEAGRLRVSVESAVRLIHAGGCGVTFSLMAAPPDERDPRLSDTMRDAVLAAITTGAPSAKAARGGGGVGAGAGRVAARAVALRAVLSEADANAISPGERQLLGEWLDRLSS